MNDLMQELGIKLQAGGISWDSLLYMANLATVAKATPEIAASIIQELDDQRASLKLVASENYCSLSVQAAMANLLTDKYAEGFPFHRFYAGCQNVDDIEQRACDLACELFGSDHAYVQPHSGADANLIAFWSILTAKVETPELEALGLKNAMEPTREQWDDIRHKLGNQKLLGMNLFSGGHLTHGYRFNLSAKMFDSHTYSVDKETKLLDYDALAEQVKEIQPLILLAGYSAYPRKINFARMREIADSVGAVFMVDMAHFAGLVAGGVFEGDYNPVQFADVVTTTTHKTLRGPRGGLILCKKEFAEYVDKGCPLAIGGPLPHVMAAKAVCFQEALQPEFKEYAQQIVENSQALAAAFQDDGVAVSSDGTDNHLVLVDVTSINGLTGRQAELAMRECGITLNRNAVPFDPNGPWYTSGLRLGTAAMTTLGMGPDQMREIGSIMLQILRGTHPTVTSSGEPSKAKFEIDSDAKEQASARLKELLASFQVYPEIDTDLLRQSLNLQETAAAG